MMGYAIFLILSIIILSAIASISICEHFLFIDVNMDPTMLYILYDDFNFTKGLKKLEENKIVLTKHEKPTTLVISDVHNFLKNSKKDVKIFSIIPDTKDIMFIRPQINFLNRDIRTYNKIVYLQEQDRDLLKLMLVSMSINIPIEKADLKKITSYECIFVFNCLNNPAFYDVINAQSIKYDFIEFDHLVNHKFLIGHLPFIKKRNVVISDFLPNQKAQIKVITVYSIDMILYGSSSLEKNKSLIDQFDHINKSFNNHDVINYYSQYFRFFSQTEDYAFAKNTTSIDRNLRPILEQ
jgi:hypothetical protein